MGYKRIQAQKMSEDELRDLWKITYCDSDDPIHTFDGVLVKFNVYMFDHAFYESENWEAKDKSILSLNRCSKMLWIKDVLQDETAILKAGWNNKSKSYDDGRRVALVKGNYVVIIRFVDKRIAVFVTAFEFLNGYSLNKFLRSPDWTGHDEWL